MKTRASFVFIFLTGMIAMLGLAGCESSTAPKMDAQYGVADFVNGAPPEVSKPFKTWGYSDLAGLAPDASCGGAALNTQVGELHATHLGKFDVTFTFCVDPTDLLDDGQLTEGESLPYWNGVATFVADNGDELYVEISGTILPSTDPDYDFQFQDPFTFVGGTGRFEGATGGGTTDSYVDQAANRTYHHWQGTLTTVPGK